MLADEDNEDITAIPDDPVAVLQPVAFLYSRMVKKGASVLSQIKVQWSDISNSITTWEEASDLRRRFPACAAWGQAAFRGGGNARISKRQLRGVSTVGRPAISATAPAASVSKSVSG